MDAQSLLAWATAPGRRLRLAELDGPARRFLAEGGDGALDLMDRCLDLLDRLTGPEPDLDGVRLPERFVDAARKAAAAQGLGQPAARRTGITAPARRGEPGSPRPARRGEPGLPRPAGRRVRASASIPTGQACR